MHHKTEGIVLHTFSYSDNSLIVKIYTRLFGLQTYLVKGIKSKRSGFRPTYFQPLTLLSMEAGYRQKKTFQQLKEVRVDIPFHSICEDQSKRSVILFLNEILYKTIREEEPNAPLFDYIASSLVTLERLKGSCANFHLYFIIHLTRYLGFYPQTAADPFFFDLKEGVFTRSKPSHECYLSPEISPYLAILLETKAENIPAIIIPADHRKILLQKMILYYELHLHLPKIRSIGVLEEVFQ